MVKRIRIVLAGMSGMVLEVMEATLALHPEFLVAAHVPQGDDVAAAMRRYRADVLVTMQSAEDSEEADVEMMFRQRPARIVSITGDGRNATLYRLQVHATHLTDLSVNALVDAIGSARADNNTTSALGDC